MNLVFLMDPLETVIYHKDSSFILMLGACHRGHRVFYLPKGGISVENGRVSFLAEEVVAQANPDQPFLRTEPRRLSDTEVDAVFVRTDPPFDADYLSHTWLLDLLPARILVVNEPRGLRTVNEKIWALRFPDLLPPSLLTRDLSRYQEFLKRHQAVVVKPTDGHGGAGVFVVRDGDTNASVVFETLSGHGSREVVVQQFVPAADAGDKRILLLDGEPLGAVLRVHGEGDHRNNFFAGGTPHSARITPRDQVIIDRLRPSLRELGLYFTGIDVIGDYLIEVNVTSPTGLQEVNRLDGVALEERVIAFVEERVRARQGAS